MNIYLVNYKSKDNQLLEKQIVALSVRQAALFAQQDPMCKEIISIILQAED